MTTAQIFACVIAWSAAIVAVWALVFVRRARVVPYAPPPREHCGNLSPQIFEHSLRTECVLRPGHAGSHANGRGARWWYDPSPASEEEPS